MKRWRFKNLLLIICLLEMGCAGRNPKPVTIYQDGDAEKACKQLELEMTGLRHDADKLFPHTDKTLGNALWGTAGVLLIIPYCGMDLKNAEKVEYEAIAKRHNYLLNIALNNNCQVNYSPIPSLEEYKATLKESKETLTTKVDE
jgi:hypothetical protein